MLLWSHASTCVIAQRSLNKASGVCVGGVIRDICDLECERVIEVFVISLESECACGRRWKKCEGTS